VAHLNHGLRGRSSDADEALVVTAAGKVGTPVFVDRVGKGELRQVPNKSVEMAARERRHAFLARVAQEWGARKIVLAHHADDQVELFFLRVLRGSSSQGLAGMRPTLPLPGKKGLWLVRPLLETEKSQLEAYARSALVKFRTDASNDSWDIPRNRIRHELLPQLKAHYQPAIVPVITRLMSILSAEAEVIHEIARSWLGKNIKGNASRTNFDKLPLAVRRWVIHDQLLARGISPDFALIDNLVSHPDLVVCVRGAHPDQCEGELPRVLRDGSGKLNLVQSPPEPLPADATSVYLSQKKGKLCFAGVEIYWKVLKRKKKGIFITRSKTLSKVEHFDADKVGHLLQIRRWRAGDKYQPIGLDGRKKLQDCFTDLKVARELRHQLLVATSIQGEILWVECLRIAEQFKVTEGTVRTLVWRWKRL
jgi:tRNA(Ile)-lysidine synthase